MEYQELFKGYKLFPCKDKIPAVKNGYKDARANIDIVGLLQKGYNIGMPMDINELFAVDMDVDGTRGLNGIETIVKLEATLGELPFTLTSKTPRGGRHKIYSANGINNPIGKFGNDVDFKYRGYIMIPPSKINGIPYQIIDGINENGKPVFADLPQPWLDFINKPIKTSIPNNISSKSQQVVKPCHFENIDIAKVFERCSMLRFCANPENAYDLPEPLWHSMICALAHFEGCEDLIHELSEPYYNYSFEETQKKIDYAKAFGRPQSCAYISANYPEICGSCPSAVKNRGDN